MTCYAMVEYIQYKGGYKYQLIDDYEYWFVFDEALAPVEDVTAGRYLTFSRSGLLGIRAGYCWDGPSGLARDTRTFMRGSLIHDALYQLIRTGHLGDANRWKDIADQVLRELCLKDGMWWLRAWYTYYAVRLCGRWYLGARKPVLTAP